MIVYVCLCAGLSELLLVYHFICERKSEKCLLFPTGFVYYSKRHNKFLFPALAETTYGRYSTAENEISNVFRSLPSKCHWHLATSLRAIWNEQIP